MSRTGSILSLSVLVTALACGCASPKRASAPSVVAAPATQPDRAPASSSIYPPARRDTLVETHFGVPVADPYRWLEEMDSRETRAWVSAENHLADRYFAQIPGIEQLRSELAELQRVTSYSPPLRRGGRYFWIYHDGHSSQPVIETSTTLNGEPSVLLDANTISTDGSLAFKHMAISDDGRRIAYGIAQGGGDWLTWYVRDVATGNDLPDALPYIKYYDPVFNHEGTGIYYSRFPTPPRGKELTEPDHDHRLYFHKLGKPTTEDRLIYARPDHPTEQFQPQISRDGRHLVIRIGDGEVGDRGVEQIGYLDLARPRGVSLLVPTYEADYEFAGNAGQELYFVTSHGAANKEIVTFDLRKRSPVPKVIVPEGKFAIQTASLVGKQLLVTFMQDAHSTCTAFNLAGHKLREIALPGLGSVLGFEGHDHEAFNVFESFTQAPSVFRYNLETGLTSSWKQPTAAFDPATLETRQIFFASKDGTQVPMFVTSKKGLVLDGSHPTLITAYGFGGVPYLPYFEAANIAWVLRGGVSVLVNVRGGGEYGEAWHKAAWREHRQTGFDDFIAAGQWLIDHGYTSHEHLGAVGTSGGGMLVAAVTVERPDLFGASAPIAGVDDLLRFPLFGEGAGWQGDLGSPADSEADFQFLAAISPVHNVRSGTTYPATFVITSDHDVRVAPLHSYKFAAALQAAQKGPAAIVMRVETQSGHGRGSTLSQRVSQNTEVLAFFARNLGLSLH